jgi:hypothetical protein
MLVDSLTLNKIITAKKAIKENPIINDNVFKKNKIFELKFLK